MRRDVACGRQRGWRVIGLRAPRACVSAAPLPNMCPRACASVAPSLSDMCPRACASVAPSLSDMCPRTCASVAPSLSDMSLSSAPACSNFRGRTGRVRAPGAPRRTPERNPNPAPKYPHPCRAPPTPSTLFHEPTTRDARASRPSPSTLFHEITAHARLSSPRSTPALLSQVYRLLLLRLLRQT